MFCIDQSGLWFATDPARPLKCISRGASSHSLANTVWHTQDQECVQFLRFTESTLRLWSVNLADGSACFQGAFGYRIDSGRVLVNP